MTDHVAPARFTPSKWLKDACLHQGREVTDVEFRIIGNVASFLRLSLAEAEVQNGRLQVIITREQARQIAKELLNQSAKVRVI
jgi:hypothetical protein